MSCKVELMYLSGFSAVAAHLLVRVVRLFHTDWLCAGRPRPQPERRSLAQQSAAEETSNI